MDITPVLLLVDDDPSIRRLCSRMLTRMGFEFLEAENGLTGRQQFEEHGDRLHGVLMDLNLPDVSGRTLATEFGGARPQLPVIYFTGSATSSEGVAEDGTVEYYLKKPFTKATLEEALAKAGVPAPPSATGS